MDRWTASQHLPFSPLTMSKSVRKDMEYVNLGESGLRISKVILGCMSYGKMKNLTQWALSEEEGIEHIRIAYAAGIQTFDTANIYGDGQSEVMLGKAIKQLNLPREEIVVMTKCYWNVIKNPGDVMLEYIQHVDLAEKDGYINQRGGSRKNIFASVQASLKRLQLDYIDVLQMHRIDTRTPIAETMQALHDVVKMGWVHYIGMSTCFAYQFHQMQNYAITNKLTPFISMQNLYNLVYREEETEMFPTLKLFGVSSIPWSPLARGGLTRSIDAQTERGDSDPMSPALWLQHESNRTIVNRVEEIAKKRGASMAQISLAWIFQKPGVAAPIVGVTSIAQLNDVIAGLKSKLTPEEVRYLEEPYKTQPSLTAVI
ncbi:aryl-alcohol dehydrogenase [Mycena floridula]|nr:aryl-alcohol dehydrogenase [Mycena floridula]